MNMDTELEVWRREWQSDDAVPAHLRMMVARQTRWMRIALAAEILVTVVMGGGVTLLALRSPALDMLVLAAATWLFIIVAWVISVGVNRGNWKPAALDTVSFLEVSIRRCLSRLTSLAFAAGLFVCEIVFCLGWIYRRSGKPRQPLTSWLLFGSLGVDIAWVLTLIFVASGFWYWRKKRAELAHLLDLQAELGGKTEEVISRRPRESWSRQRLARKRRIKNQ